MKIKLEKVRYIPKDLVLGVLYVSEEFGAGAHLCACGCGAKIRTPIGPTEWQLEETKDGPSLSPSIGNWQQACKSHYWIDRGQIRWARKWTDAEIAAGRRAEEARRRSYYDSHGQGRRSIGSRVGRWLMSLFGGR